MLRALGELENSRLEEIERAVCCDRPTKTITDSREVQVFTVQKDFSRQEDAEMELQGNGDAESPLP